MKRSMYSLILMDDVISEIDRMARQQGTSRSNYVNQILAKHVSCVTPEQQMHRIFSCVVQQMDSSFRVQEQGSNAMLSILGAIQYKYQPTIRYSVELLRDQRHQKAGQLKISCRTQSRSLLQAMQSFFQFWIQLEQRLNSEQIYFPDKYEIQGGRMTIILLRSDMADDEIFGTAVGNYIRMFHAVLQSYFTGLQQKLSTSVLQHALKQQYHAIRNIQAPNL